MLDMIAAWDPAAAWDPDKDAHDAPIIYRSIMTLYDNI